MRLLKDYFSFLLCACILLLPNIYAMAVCADLAGSVVKEVAYLVVVLFLFTLPFMFLKARTALLLESVVSILSAPVELACLYINNHTSTADFLKVIISTNVQEASELLQSYWGFVIAYVVLWLVFYVLAMKVRNEYLFTSRFRRLYGFSSCVLFVVGLMGMYGLSFMEETPMNTSQRVGFAFRSIGSKFYKIYPYNVFLSALSDVETEDIYAERDAYVIDVTQKEDSMPETYVLVIGESVRYDHLSLNGYERETTPNLSEISNLYSFSNVSSTANATTKSVSMMMVGASDGQDSLAYKKKSLPEIFKKAGFYSCWISNQKMSPMSHHMADSLDVVKDSNLSLTDKHPYDSVLVNAINYLKDDGRNFMVLHSIGCHFRYDNRAPSSYWKFKPTIADLSVKTSITQDNLEYFVNSYDNAVLYMDHILSSIINEMQKRKGLVVVVYISDHGENFMDDQRKLTFHATVEGSEYEYHVPMLVWVNDAFKTKYPEKMDALKQNLKKDMESDVVFNSLLDAASLSSVSDPAKSVFSDLCKAKDKPYYTGKKYN